VAEPFKNLFNPAVISSMAGLFDRIEGFDRTAFLDIALNRLDELELMQRSDQIAHAMTASLPTQVPDILPALTALLHPNRDIGFASEGLDADGLRGWSLMPVGKYITTHGLDHPAESLGFLRELTMRSSAEFAVRPFYQQHPDQTLAETAKWARDENHHVRRLASEGCRPRLPWGIRLQAFVKDPVPLLPILTTLRDDPSEYVRRSVANNLNDIAKDHPDLVADLAADWMKNAPDPRKKLIKHACRSLIKAGHPATLAVFGYGPPEGLHAVFDAQPQAVQLGESLSVSANLHHDGPADQSVLIDLILRFLRADGSHSAKVFKWTETSIPAGEPLQLTKRLPLRKVTTRRHYPGPQFVALQVNGQVIAETGFQMEIP